MVYQCINWTNKTKKTNIVLSKTNLTRRLLSHQKNQTHHKMLQRTLNHKNYNKKRNKHIATFQALQTYFHTCKHKHKPNDN
jgi:hypothetical protein